jgi:hypothetical protein
VPDEGGGCGGVVSEDFGGVGEYVEGFLKERGARLDEGLGTWGM